MTAEEIVAATRKALLETNAAELSMRDVARQMGLAAGTIYAKFATKDEVLAQVYVQRLDEVKDFVESLNGQQLATVTDVLDRVAPSVGGLKRDFDFYFERFPAGGAGVRPETWRAIRDRSRILGRLIHGLVQSAAEREGLRLVGGSIAERFVWSALVSVSTERMALVYGHKNTSYVRFMSNAIRQSLAVDDRGPKVDD